MTSLDAYVVGEVIGKGSFGEVKKAVRRETGETVVLKTIDLSALSESEIDSISKEAEVLEHLRHDHIVRYHECFTHNVHNIVIVMEYCGGGDLQNYLRARRDAGAPIPEAEAVSMLAQIALALRYCHERRILHRDLKPSNVYRTADGQLKLGAQRVAARFFFFKCCAFKRVHFCCCMLRRFRNGAIARENK